MILEVDMGNTRLKWRLRSQAARLDGGYLQIGSDYDELRIDFSRCSGEIKRVLVASVRGAKEEQEFAQWVQENLALEVEFAQSVSACGLVTNGYAEPARLGVDRWLALLAGYHHIRGACVVVSAGTALTVDLITHDGKHLGGYIAPGIELFTKTLNQSTARIKLNEKRVDTLELAPGDNTAAAVTGACAAMIRGVVDNAMEQLRLFDRSGQLELLLTGGDAQRIHSLYPSAIYKQELVLDGLSHAFGLQSIE